MDVDFYHNVDTRQSWNLAKMSTFPIVPQCEIKKKRRKKRDISLISLFTLKTMYIAKKVYR